MLKWIVIEGDNGTGKDVLAKRLEDMNYQIINYEDSIKAVENKVRQNKRNNKIELFLEYNEICSNFNCNTNCVSLRYWPSTISAGFADNQLTDEDLRQYIERCVLRFRKPDAFIYLTCDYDERVRRIENRLIDMPELKGKDDIAIIRGKRHLDAMTMISGRYSNWYNINTTNLTIDDVYKKFMKICKELQ